MSVDLLTVISIYARLRSEICAITHNYRCVQIVLRCRSPCSVQYAWLYYYLCFPLNVFVQWVLELLLFTNVAQNSFNHIFALEICNYFDYSYMLFFAWLLRQLFGMKHIYSTKFVYCLRFDNFALTAVVAHTPLHTRLIVFEEFQLKKVVQKHRRLFDLSSESVVVALTRCITWYLIVCKVQSCICNAFSSKLKSLGCCMPHTPHTNNNPIKLIGGACADDYTFVITILCAQISWYATSLYPAT